MPNHTVAWIREGGIVECIYVHSGSLKDVGSYLLANVKQSNIAEMMVIGDRSDIHDDTGDLDESVVCKSINHLLDDVNTQYIYILNRIGFWEVATGEHKRLNHLDNVLSQTKQENEFTTGNIDIELLKAEIIDELMEVLPEVILDKFDERMYTIFGIKPPTKH
jgi:hypothetical protein